MRLSLREVQSSCESLGKGLPPVDALVCIPRGGIPVGAMVAPGVLRQEGITSQPLLCEPQDVMSPAWPTAYGFAVVDDVYATGTTLDAALVAYPHLHAARAFVVLVDKGFVAHPDIKVLHFAMKTQDWVDFPWEGEPGGTQTPSGPEDAVRRLIEFIGDDPQRPGLRETPRRVLAFLDEMRENALAEFTPTTFESEINDLVVVSHIPFGALCEHHLQAFYGEAAVGYIPHGKILGLSKIARIVKKRAAGLSVQEELARHIAEDVASATGSKDIAVRTSATHSCMIIRGPRALGSLTFANAMLGAFRADVALRVEFLGLIR